MSRIGKRPVVLPEGSTLYLYEVDVSFATSKQKMNKIVFSGRAGTVESILPPSVCLRNESSETPHPQSQTTPESAETAPAKTTTSPAGGNRPIGDPAVQLPRARLIQTYTGGNSVSIEIRLPKDSPAKPLKKSAKASLLGRSRTLLENMVVGGTHCFEKKLELKGVGYRADKTASHESSGNEILKLYVGKSHVEEIAVHPEVSVDLPSPTEIVIKGISKQLVGNFAAKVRDVRPPEPYKGKGISYAGEQIQRKAVKASK